MNLRTNPKLRLAARLLAIIPPLLFLLFAFFVVRRQFQMARPQLVRALTAELSRRLSLDLSLNEVDTGTPGIIRIRGATVTKPGIGRLLAAERVTVHYSIPVWAQKPERPVAAVTLVEADGATVYVERDSAGKVNFQKAFPPRAAGGETFAGRVRVRNSRVFFTDLATPAPGSAAARAVFYQVDASADMRSGKGALLEVSSRRSSELRAGGQRALSGSLEARGAYSSKGGLVVSGSLAKLGLEFVGRHYVPRPDVRLTGGEADGRFLLTREPGKGIRPTYWLKAQGRQVAARLPGQLGPVSGAEGSVEIASDAGMTFTGTGTAAGGRWAAAGAVAPLRAGSRDAPALVVDARSRSVDFGQALRMLPKGLVPKGVRAEGRGPVGLRIRGTTASPVVGAELQAPVVMYGATRLTDVRAVLDWRGTDAVFRASARSGRGVAAGEGRISKGSGALQASTRFRFHEIALDHVPVPQIKGTVSGLASGDGELVLHSGRPSGAVRFQVARPSILGRTASSVRGRIGFDGRRMLVQSLLVSTREGFITASGPVGLDGTLALKVSGAGIELSRLLQKGDDITGTLDVAGDLGGNLRNPVFRGRVQLVEAQIQGEQVDFASGEVVASRSRVSSDDLLVTRGLSEVRLSGEVLQPLLPGRQLALDAQVKSIDLADLRRFDARLDRVAGRVSGEIRNIRGNLSNLSGSFRVTVDGFRYGSVNIPEVAAEGSYQRGVLELASVRATRGETTLSASGRIGPAQRLELNIAEARLSAAEMTALMGHSAPLEGTLVVSGVVTGTTSAPRAEIKIASSGLKLAGQDLTIDPTTATFAENRLSVEDAAVHVAGGTVSVQELVVRTGEPAGIEHASIDLGEAANGMDVASLASAVRASGLAAKVENQRVRTLLLSAPERLSGRIGGNITLQDAPGGVVASAKIGASDLMAWGVDVGEVSSSGSYSNGGYTLENLRAENEEALIVASGAMSSEGRISADVEGNNIPLKAVPQVPALAQSGGVASFSFTAEGTIVDPQVQGSILVSNATFGSVRVEQIDTGLVTLDKDSADISEAIVASGNHRVRLSGTVPFSITAFSLVEGSPIDLQATLLEQDLDILALFTDRIDKEATQGEVRASVSATGSWPNFQVNGLVEVADGTIDLVGMNTAFRDVQVRLELAGDKANIRQFSVTSSDGGELTVTGGADLTSDGWKLDARALAKDFGIDFRNLTQAYNESFRGKVDLDLGVTGLAAKPLIKGDISLHNGSLGLPTIAETATSGSKLPIDPTFDVRLAAGRDLRVRNPRLNVGVRGGVQLARSLSSPSVTGQLEVTEGYLLFPGSRFRVVPVGLIEFAYEPPDSTSVTLDIRAQTQLAGSSIASGLIRSGPNYRVEMHIKGPLADPQVSFQSNPPGLTANGIVSMLGQQAGIDPSGFGGEQSFRNEITRIFTASVAPGLFEPIELALAEAFGLQELTIGVGTYEPVNLQFTRRLFDGVSFTYWRSLAADDDLDEWKLSYDITDWIRLSYGETRYRTTFVGFEGTFRF